MHPKHISIPNTLYSITVRCARGLVPFNDKNVCRTYLSVLHQKIIAFQFGVLAFVLMPDHIHLIIKLPESILLQKMMNHINGATSREINKLNGTTGQKFWQGGFYDVRIRGLTDFTVKVNYIHNNPVKAGLALTPADFKFSSARFYTDCFGFAIFDSRSGDRSQISKIQNTVSDLLKNELNNIGSY